MYFSTHTHKIKPKRHRETFGDDEYDYHFDFKMLYTLVHICQNSSNYTLNMLRIFLGGILIIPQ